MKIVKIFESLLQENLIAFTRSNDMGKTYLIDLHCYYPWEAQFILRYILAFEIDNILKQNEKYNQNVLSIIVGSGKHNKYKNKFRLRDFIINDLFSYEPAIKANINKDNEGRIDINHSELIEYRNNIGVGNNSAFKKLQAPSEPNDWFLHTNSKSSYNESLIG